MGLVSQESYEAIDRTLRPLLEGLRRIATDWVLDDEHPGLWKAHFMGTLLC
jgi:hypothetical protein